MERIPFIPPSEINFIPILPNRKTEAPKTCTLCTTELGSIGLIKSVRKTCYFCKNSYCKNCASRKITHQKKRVCETCYTSSIRRHFESRISESLQNSLSGLDQDIRLKQEKILSLKSQILNLKNSLTHQRESLNSTKSDEKLKLLPLLDEVKLEKNKCNRARSKVLPLEETILTKQKVFEELGKEVYHIEKIICQKAEEVQCLKENLATAQDLNKSLLLTLEKRTIGSSHCESGLEITSLSELRSLKTYKYNEVEDLAKRKKDLMAELEQIGSEIEMYTKRRSCRHSGQFNLN